MIKLCRWPGGRRLGLLAALLALTALVSLPMRAETTPPTARSGLGQGFAPTPEAPEARGRGYVAPPFDTSHLNNYPEVSAQGPTLARWDWREQGKVTAVRNQGSCGSCYAFATLGSLEAQALIRDGVAYDLSENNLIECDYGQSGCNGGNIWITTNRMSAYGAVLESCDPYSASDETCNAGCPAALVATQMWVLGGNAVPPTDALKGWLQSYGPLYISMDAGGSDAWGQEFSSYNGSYTFYHPINNPSLNHAVLLVGWDDNLAHAGGNGAWIVKNSWGTSWGGTCGYGAERGYFTIAYDSAGIGSNAAVVRDWRPAESAGTLLYHDEGGLQGGIGWNGTYGPYGLARLTPQQNGAATYVEVWTMGPGSVDIAIYDAFNGQTPSGLLWQKQGVSLDAAGYHSVAVDAPVAIQAGNDVSVQVRFNTTNVYTALPVDNLGPVSAARSYANRTGAAGSWLDLAGQSTPLDVGIRLRVGAAPATPTPTATPTHTPTATYTATPTPTPTTPSAAQEIPLQAGWNLVSFHVRPSSSAVADVLASIAGLYESVLGYDQGAKSYYPDLPPSFSDLQTLDPEHGYWIQMRQAATLRVTGAPVGASAPLPLDAGWNLVGYLPEGEIAVAEALASISGQYEAVLGFHDGGAVSYYADLPPTFSDLRCLRPGHGYWIKTTEAATLVYPAGGTCAEGAGALGAGSPQ